MFYDSRRGYFRSLRRILQRKRKIAANHSGKIRGFFHQNSTGISISFQSLIFNFPSAYRLTKGSYL